MMRKSNEIRELPADYASWDSLNDNSFTKAKKNVSVRGYQLRCDGIRRN